LLTVKELHTIQIGACICLNDFFGGFEPEKNPGQECQRLSIALNDVPNADFLLIENTSGVNAGYENRIEE
jgi:hypothetical protein